MITKKKRKKRRKLKTIRALERGSTKIESQKKEIKKMWNVIYLILHLYYSWYCYMLTNPLISFIAFYMEWNNQSITCTTKNRKNGHMRIWRLTKTTSSQKTTGLLKPAARSSKIHRPRGVQSFSWSMVKCFIIIHRPTQSSATCISLITSLYFSCNPDKQVNYLWLCFKSFDTYL